MVNLIKQLPKETLVWVIPSNIVKPHYIKVFLESLKGANAEADHLPKVALLTASKILPVVPTKETEILFVMYMKNKQCYSDDYIPEYTDVLFLEYTQSERTLLYLPKYTELTTTYIYIVADKNSQ